MDDDRTLPSFRDAIATTLWLVLAASLGTVCAVGVAYRFSPPGAARFEALEGDRRQVARDAGAARRQMLSLYARDASGAERMDAARRNLRRRVAGEIPPGRFATLTPAARCEARLAGLARVMRSLASAAPASIGAGSSPVLKIPASTREAVMAAVAGRDVVALDLALATEFQQWHDGLFADARRLDPETRGGIWSHWRGLLVTRAAEFEFLASSLAPALRANEREGVAAAAALAAFAFEPRVPDPSLALAAFPVAPQVIVVRPMVRFWAPPAILGALVAMAAVSLWRRSRRRRAVPRDLGGESHPPEADTAWLNVVTGGRPEPITRAVCELAARALARRQRVVVVDASRGLRLHETLALSAQLGFADCVGAGAPALGLLQNSGFTGLFLLSRGRGGPITHWLPLDRVVEELRPHFAKVILAFDPGVPEVVGGVLAGRVMSGWWAGPGPAQSRAARSAGDRLAIALQDLNLSGITKASLEGLEARLVALAAARPAPATAVRVGPDAPRRYRVSAPAVLDCDLQIRQKLRFLVWMRRMRAERKGSEPAGRT